MYDNLNMIYVEIPKLKKEKEDLNSHLEWWLYIFQNLNRLQEIPKALKGDVIEKAFEKAEFINMPKVEQDKYHKNLKIYRDLINSFNTASKDGYKKGIKEGMEQGIKEGMEKGIEKERETIAKNLILANLDIETIMQSTGLSREDIERLKKKQI